jgi:hypothetical protein
MAVASGSNIDLLLFKADSFERVAGASLPATVSQEQAIFGARMHPAQPWIYATSSFGTDWGDSRIDRFEVTPAGLVHRDATVLR